ncbi:MAG TPA: glycosyltransferase family 2 protein [Nocardioidaceae bacterium]|nr:glycosyltransferase family 2 protein [Nocardioidaceae bacterium]
MPLPYDAQSSVVPPRSVPLTVVVLTRDEEVNIGHCLASVAWAAQVVVVDSGSTDATTAIARAGGATVVETHWRGFGSQREFALRLPEVDHDWVLFVDADEWVSDDLAQEVCYVVPSADHAAFWLYFRLVFQGRWISHCGWYPSARIIRLVDRRVVTYPDQAFSEHPVVDGTVARLTHDLVDEDRKGLASWVTKHVRYAQLEARRRTAAPPDGEAGRRTHDSGLRSLLKDVVAPRLPARPLATFGYMYVLRGGFLDGRVGLLFCFLHGWFQVLVQQLQREKSRLEAAEIAPSPARGRDDF